MSDYIKREDAIAEIMSIPSGTIHTDYAVFILDRIPRADVVEVVRCGCCDRSEQLTMEDLNDLGNDADLYDLWCCEKQCYTKSKGFCDLGEQLAAIST